MKYISAKTLSFTLVYCYFKPQALKAKYYSEQENNSGEFTFLNGLAFKDGRVGALGLCKIEHFQIYVGHYKVKVNT